MIINIWTTNEAKIGTIRELEWFYDRFVIDRLVPCTVESGISEQPIDRDEIVTGAINRAKNAYTQSPCDLAIGMEAWIIPLKQAETWYVACEAVAIRDGKKIHLGIGGGFEYPPQIIERVIKNGEDINTAFINSWFSQEFAGNKSGVIWFLTNSKLTRKDCSRQIIIYALAQIHHKNLY